MKNLVVVVFLLGSCAKPAATETAAPVAAAAPEPAAAPSDGTVPRMFTAQQLHAGMPTGTKIRYRIEVQGQPAVEERWEVTASDNETCTIASTVHDATTGAVIEDQGAATSTWLELLEHAAFPAAMTTIEEGTSVTVPAGTFPTRRFTVRGEDGTVNVFDFAPTLPGPPIQLVATKDGATVMSMILLERS